MLLNWDASLLIAAGASFMAGLLGYIIVRMWIKPIVAYTLSKRRLGHALTRYLEQTESRGQAGTAANAQTFLKQARRYAVNLEARYQADIPAWYRLLLVSRSHSPEKALSLLGPLSKMTDGQQIAKRVDELRKTVGLC